MRLGLIQGRKNQNYVFEYFLHMSVLVIDCYWCAFGEIQDRFDLRIPPYRITYILTGWVRCNTLVYVIHLSNVKCNVK